MGMASILSVSRYLKVIPFLLLYFRTLYADFNVSFASKDVDKGSYFESMFAFYGDAKLVGRDSGNGMSVRLSGSDGGGPSAGRVVYKHPMRLVVGGNGNPRDMVSFETKFGFSLSEKGDGLAFLMAPVEYPVNEFDGGSFGLLGKSKMKFLAVEFDTHKDGKYGDVNANHVGLDNSSLVLVKVSNVSSVNLTLSSGKKLQAWINYQAMSHRIEVRLAEFGETNKPIDPLLSYPVDMSRMWGEKEVLFGLSSASGNSNSLQECNLYSWSLELWTIPHWMHSQPMNPNAYMEKTTKEYPVPEQKSDCTFRVLGALIFGIGCGALGALIVLFIWTLLAYKRPIVPEDYAEKHLEFEFKKPKIVDKPSGKN
ncbi:OLC1v1035000C1 [Oldenlandia corymbosa var. corymbosa]|uniref:OLC1v1035000C1 n=1 Tax=Oldenlandia corymbosa var. corymbosa TaxID=529605 RepID=A0AAV1CV17_OLDCO|nr:OLC1v1035000C1 [Oldenlandia corymbosa var. corymbosa]